MSEIDRELVRRKLENLLEHLQKLREFKGMEVALFLNDHHNYGLAEHYLQMAIEIVLDVSRHLVVALGLKTPEDSRGLFLVLGEAGVLPAAFVEKNSNMAGFRNRLVHEYADIDHNKVYGYLQSYLDEFEKFISLASQFLEKSS